MPVARIALNLPSLNSSLISPQLPIERIMHHIAATLREKNLLLIAFFMAICIALSITGCQDKSNKMPVSAIVTEDNWQILSTPDSLSSVDGQVSSSTVDSSLFRIVGYIYDKNTRLPVTNVNVDLRLNGVSRLVTRSTSAGMFIFENIPTGLYDIYTFASPAIYLNTNHVVRILQDGSSSPTELEVLLDLVPATTNPGQVTYSVTGEARDEVSGAPAANEFMKLFDASGTLVSTALTDSQGKYSFEQVIPGTYNIEIAKGSDKYFERTITINLSSLGKVAPTPIILLSDKTVETSTIEGTVKLGSSQAAMGGITVQLRQSSVTSTVLSSQVSNGEGRFFFENLLPGTYFLTAAEGSVKYEPETFIVTILRDGSVSPLNASIFIIAKVISQQTYTVKGNILDAFSGSPLDFVTCTLKEVGPIITDLNGIFYFEQLPEGDYQVSLEKAGFNNQTVPFKLDSAGKTIPASLTFRMVYNQELNKGSIVGRICDITSGAGIPDLIVRIYPMSLRDPSLDKDNYNNWIIDPRPIKTTKTHSSSVHPETGFDETGAFKLTHLEPTTDSVKYLVYAGLGNSFSIITASGTEDISNPNRVDSWAQVNVTQNTSTYLVNYDPTK